MVGGLCGWFSFWMGLIIVVFVGCDLLQVSVLGIDVV